MIRKKWLPVKNMNDLFCDWRLDWESVIIRVRHGSLTASLNFPPNMEILSLTLPQNASEVVKGKRQEVNVSLANAKDISQVCPIAPKRVGGGIPSVLPGEYFLIPRKLNSPDCTFGNEEEKMYPVFHCRLCRKHVRVLQPAAADQSGTDVHCGFGS